MHSKTLKINSHHLVLMANVKDAPFKCLSCKKVFISENHLKRHEDRRHNSKISSISPQQVKGGTIYETANESTIKAVLNATERIEDLLVKLSLRENKKKSDIPMEFSLPRSNFDSSTGTSTSSFSTEKNDQNIENCQFTSSDSTLNKKQMEITKLKCNGTSNFDNSLVPLSYFNTDNNELSIQNCECISNESTTNKKQIKVVKMNYNERCNFNDTLVTSNSYNTVGNEQNIENCKYFSNDRKPNKNIKERTNLEFNEMNNFEDTLVPSNCNSTTKNIENCKYFSNDSTSNKNIKEMDYLKSNEMDNFDNSLVISNSSANEINISSGEHVFNDSTGSKKQKEKGDLKYNKRSDFKDTQVASDSLSAEKSEQLMESSECISIGNIPFKKSKHITKMTCNDFLEEQENRAIWRITSSIIKSSDFSVDILDPVYSENDHGNEKNDLVTLYDDSLLEERPMIKSRSRLKLEILGKLNNKLESYGVKFGQNRLSDKDMIRIGQLLKEERDRIAEEKPDYHKLRQLIKDNAHRRIKENLQVHSSYVY
ncbi:uncharacterized protein DDB_G0287625 [Halyomorpha halys]|uniref:uncharacterized protein DDB_G0287625 n=1 Tax=Halyomorpha halys TaxID=286706 RepID=UPI0006D4EB70|nr:GATA zinc finger domain-containing protein 14-like [Halyomorpha halys]XP_014279399.1 GATA zinc finger domain-containing protein 14-like [Halyomorpha halys]XP_014279486.1 GATA zinc finger domain-containing protein 14-like [Halyomorpha halys]